MKDLQQAADDVGVIAEAIETLGELLVRFHRDHGSELYERLTKTWPDAERFGGSAPDPLFKLERDLTPPDEGGPLGPLTNHSVAAEY